MFRRRAGERSPGGGGCQCRSSPSLLLAKPRDLLANARGGRLPQRQVSALCPVGDLLRESLEQRDGPRQGDGSRSWRLEVAGLCVGALPLDRVVRDALV